MKYPKLQEEELKNKVARDVFGLFDCTAIIKNIDFAVKNKGLELQDTCLIADLRSALKTLVAKIEPKVYEYGFLKK